MNEVKTCKHIIFGGKGFIGQNLSAYLLNQGFEILVIDKNFWNLRWLFPELEDSQAIQYIEADINNLSTENLSLLENFIKNSDQIQVWHLAANSDISTGNQNINIDLKDTFYTTLSIIEICCNFGIDKINFASSSAVYGSAKLGETGFSEADATQPISSYGAMKLASEAVLRSAFEQHLNKCLIFRFPNVIGYPATHGVIRDFIRKLQNTPRTLKVLGDGEQSKPYLHVHDLVKAMVHLNVHYSYPCLEVINIGSPFQNVQVKEIAEIVISKLAPSADIVYGTTSFGWVGDMPEVVFDISKILDTGWSCELDGHSAVKLTITENLEKSFL